jgi:hypothetical protein
MQKVKFAQKTTIKIPWILPVFQLGTTLIDHPKHLLRKAKFKSIEHELTKDIDALKTGQTSLTNQIETFPI